MMELGILKEKNTMDRRKFLALSSGVVATKRTGVLSLSSLSTQFAKPPVKRRDSKRRPKVILMICDDLGFGDLGAMGRRFLPQTWTKWQWRVGDLRGSTRGMRFARLHGPPC
jgi:hypothetical protein